MGMLIRIESRDWQEKNLAYTAAWRIGTVMEVKPSMVKEVTEIEVDGEELIFILNTFARLPIMVKKDLTHWHDDKPMRWYGDHARFIVGNLL